MQPMQQQQHQTIAPAPPAVISHNLQQDSQADHELRATLAATLQHSYPDPNSTSPHEHDIDPSMDQSGMMSNGGDSGGDDSMGGGKGGKRELSQSKRAAQNRAAQRAFRQRKEGYIKKLEEQVREFHTLEDNFKSIQAENYSLREYIIHLQSRLIESQGDYPQPPPNVNLSHPHARHDQQQQPQHAEHLQQRHETAPVAPMTLNPSAARNLAAAGLNSGKHAQEEQSYEQHKRFKDSSNDEAATADELICSQYANSHQLPQFFYGCPQYYKAAQA